MSHPRRPGHLLLRSALAALTAVGLCLVAAAPSYAEDGYRYWNYSHLQEDGFVAAQTGAADHVPADGDVEGWRFGTSTVAQGIWPRADLDEVTFAAVCDGGEPGPEDKRVAVLVDYGVAEDAGAGEVPQPRAECAVVPADASGAAVLEAVADVRAEGGLVCGLDGIPARGCGDEVADVEVPADEATVAFALPAPAQDAEVADDTANATDAAEDSDDSGLGWPLALGLLVLVGLAVGTLVVSVRRSRQG